MATKTTNIEPLLTTQQVADLFGTKVAHVRDLEKHMGLPSIRVGNLIRYRPEDIEAWLESRRRP